MTKLFSEYYIIKSLRDEYELGGIFYSIELAREEIDNVNKKAIDHGYPAHRFIICKRYNTKVREDNGTFAMSTIVKMAVETYPEQL